MYIINYLIFATLGAGLGLYASRVGIVHASLYEDGEEVGSLSFKERWVQPLDFRLGLGSKRLQFWLSLFGALALTACYAKFDLSMEMVMATVIVIMLTAIFATDLLEMIIPNRILILFLPIIMALRILSNPLPWWSPIAGAVAGYGIIFVIIVVTKGGMGGGDMKLFGVLGIVLGLAQVLLAFFLACLIGAIGGFMFQLAGKTKRRQPIPFGPYIIVATFVAYLYGTPILAYYYSFF